MAKYQTKSTSAPHRTYKQVLGFASDNPAQSELTPDCITIFKGDTYPHLEWFRASAARYSTVWGWYFICTEPIPEDLPTDITPIQLPWDAISINDETIKKEEAMRAAVEEILYPDIEGEWVGTIGERIEAYLTVVSATQYASSYGGNSTYHTFVDDLGNRYIWNTAAKTLTEGETYKMRGTIKELTTKKGYKLNILTRCMLRT